MDKKILKYFFLTFCLVLTGVFIYWTLGERLSSGKTVNLNPGEAAKPPMAGAMNMPPGSIRINLLKQQLIGVKKYTVRERKMIQTLRTVGRVEYDERRLGEVNLKVEGWVERLYADYTGKYVRAGDPLFELYSPDLLNAQEEYLLTTTGRGRSNLQSFSKTKLLLWDISESQIDRLERTRKPTTLLKILSPTSGYVISKSIIEGGHVQPGQTLFRIADIQKVWILGDIYENELPLIKPGQKVTVTSQALPGRNFPGAIDYIYPNIDPRTRSVKIRIEIENPDELFKPGMFTNVQIAVDRGIHLAVPESAVLNSGIRKVVFVSKGNGMFVPREVDTGSLISGFYPVAKGLVEGDVVVRSANFFLDSESQLMAAMEGMMGLIGMGDWKMEHSKMGEMDMGGMQGMKKGPGKESQSQSPMKMREDSQSKGEAE
ncbi:MAG: efflux RND transporter periplasmic adaptor subunit [Nitrospinaceae bacterium]